MTELRGVRAQRDALDSREISAVELCELHLNEIRRKDPLLNTFITIDEEGALQAARSADQRLGRQDRVHEVTGIPIAHKDVFYMRNTLTTCASGMLQEFKPLHDATIVARMADAGAVCLGKTNMDEFAMGSSNRTSFFGAVRNPWDLSRVPGGSSGGMAAAVAADLVPLASGSDTGGSIRQPAAFCGVSGLRPTYGRVSRHGMIPYAPSLDQAGPCARTVEDLGIMLSAMEGYDPKDSTSSDRAATDTRKSWGPRTLGVPAAFMQQMEEDLWSPFGKSIHAFRRQGYRVQRIELPHFDIAVAAYYLIATAEASTNLARYQGLRSGPRATEFNGVSHSHSQTRSEALGTEVKRRLLAGTYALSERNGGRLLVQAQKIRRLVTEDLLKAFRSVDLVVTPTTPTTAFELEESADSPVRMYSNDAFTVPSALAGLPALTVHCGFVGGLPAGVQLIAKHFHESELLSAGRDFQRETDWHLSVPQVPMA